MFWWKLPSEIQLEVLECLTGERMAKYASVCSEWQQFFEPHTMRSLHIKKNDVVYFRSVFHVQRRKRYLHHLTLVMDFSCLYQQLYPVKPSRERAAAMLYRLAIASNRAILEGREFYPNQERLGMDTRFSNFLFAMFLILSHWKPQQTWPRGIHLTIVDDSPSSVQVLAEEFEPGETVIHHGITIDTEAQKRSKRYALANHDWMFVLLPQVFYTMRRNPVLAITRFSTIAKYQNFYPISLMMIMSLLPSLWKFDCSMRVPEYQRNTARFSWWMLASMDIWPSRLKEIRILRAPQAKGFPALIAHYFSFLEPVSLRLACIAQNLTRLSFQQPIDAFEFFQCQQYEYRNLQSLSICSAHRILDEFPGSTDRPVIALFADISPQMPNLQTFSLFSFTVGASAVMCFSPKNGGRLILLWDWPFLHDRATGHSILKIAKVFWAYPELGVIFGPASIERIRSQIGK